MSKRIIMDFSIGQCLDHALLKEVFHSKEFLCWVCNPSQEEKSQRYINNHTWNIMSRVPLLQQTFVCKPTNPPKPNLELFQECMVQASRIVGLPIIIVGVSTSECVPPNKCYRVVFLVKDNVFLGSVHNDQSMAIAAWTVLCRKSRSTINKQMEMESSYTHGKGVFSYQHIFSYQWKNQKGEMKPLLDVSKEDVVKYLYNQRQPHHVKKLTTCDNVALEKKRPAATPLADVRKDMHILQKSHAGVDLSVTDKLHLQHYIQSAEKDRSLVENWNKKYQMLEDIYETACQCTSSEPFRMHWQDVYTTKCSADPYHPCGECRDCRTRMAQAAMVVFAAQGVSDKICLARLGSVFRHPRYANFSLEEWCCITVVELAACFKSCSKHCKNAMNCYYFLKEIKEMGPPTTLEDLVCFRSVGKKTACLWLVAVYQLSFGIPVDSHVNNKSVSLGLVPPEAKDRMDLISAMLQYWLDVSNWERLNNLIGGISQFMETDKIASLVIEAVTQRLSSNHVSVLKAFCNKRMTHSVLWRCCQKVDCRQPEQCTPDKTTTPCTRMKLPRKCKVDSGQDVEEGENAPMEDDGSGGGVESAGTKPKPSTTWIQKVLPGASIPKGDTRLPIDIEQEKKGCARNEKLFVPLIEARQQVLEELLAPRHKLSSEGLWMVQKTTDQEVMKQHEDTKQNQKQPQQPLKDVLSHCNSLSSNTTCCNVDQCLEENDSHLFTDNDTVSTHRQERVTDSASGTEANPELVTKHHWNNSCQRKRQNCYMVKGVFNKKQRTSQNWDMSQETDTHTCSDTHTCFTSRPGYDDLSSHHQGSLSDLSDGSVLSNESGESDKQPVKVTWDDSEVEMEDVEVPWDEYLADLGKQNHVSGGEDKKLFAHSSLLSLTTRISKAPIPELGEPFGILVNGSICAGEKLPREASKA